MLIIRNNHRTVLLVRKKSNSSTQWKKSVNLNGPSLFRIGFVKKVAFSVFYFHRKFFDSFQEQCR
jgi:hypothetical protein